MTLPPADVLAEQERRRSRTARTVLVVGAALSLLGAVVVGLLGASGAGSLAAACIGGALTTGGAGLVTLIGGVRDEFRGHEVPRRRMLRGVGLLLLAPLMLVFAAGAAAVA